MIDTPCRQHGRVTDHRLRAAFSSLIAAFEGSAAATIFDAMLMIAAAASDAAAATPCCCYAHFRCRRYAFAVDASIRFRHTAMPPRYALLMLLPR